MDKPKVIIELKPYLADFCRHEFKTDEEGAIILNRKHDIGKMVFSVLQALPVPPKERKIENPVTFVIPISSQGDLYQKFLHVDAWGEEKIQDYIQAKFNLRVEHFFNNGYHKNFSQKRIVEAFLAGYNIRNNALSYEAVKKNDYRRRMKDNLRIFKELQESD